MRRLVREIEEKHASRLKHSSALRESIHSFSICLEEIHRVLQNIEEKIKQRKKLTFFEFQKHIESIKKSQELYDSINRSILPLGIHINQIIDSQKINGTKKEKLISNLN